MPDGLERRSCGRIRACLSWLSPAWVVRGVALLLTLVAPAAAQNLRTQTYTELEGLPSTDVADMALASDGRVAFATRAGVGIFDGTAWEYHTPSEGFPLIYGSSRLEFDSRGRLWVSSPDAYDGLAVLEDEVWHRVRSSDGSIGGERDWVRDLALLEVEGRTTAFLLSEERTVRVVDHDGWRWLLDERGEILGGVESLATRGSALIAVTHSGLRVFDHGDADLQALETVALPPGQLRSVHFEPWKEGGDRLWVLANGWLGFIELGFIEEGAFQMASEELVEVAPVPRQRYSILPDGRGGVYFGDYTLIQHYVPGERHLRDLGMNEGLISEGASDLLRDEEGGTWIASLRGVTRIPPQVFSSFDTRQDLLDDEVTAILQLTPGELILGHPRGLSFFDGRHAQSRLFADPLTLATKRVRALDMQAGRDGAFWVAASELGAGHYAADGTATWYEPPRGAQVNSVLEDRDGQVWVATNLGLHHLDTVSRAYSMATSSQVHGMRRLYESPGGDLYSGSGGSGVFCWKRGPDGLAAAPIHSRFDGPAEPNSIYSILELDSGRTLVGTRAGLFEIQGLELVRAPEAADLERPVFSLLQDDRGRLWAGTNRGLERWDGPEQRHYDVVDGLAGQEANRAAALQDSQGRIWFGTERGVSLFDEAADAPPEELFFSSVVERVEGELLRELVLPANSDVDFEFQVVHFDQDGARTRARLLGYESEWRPERPINERELRYTNLPPGEYRLELQLRRAGEAWSDSDFSRTLTVEAPIHQRGWFLLLCAIALIALVAGITALVDFRRRASSLAVQVEERGAALAESERRYREMFTRTSAIQLVLDPENWQVLDANPAACRYFELGLADVVGRPLSELTGVSVDALALEVSRLGEDQGEELVLRPTREGRDSGPLVELRLCQYKLRGRGVVHVTVHDITAQLELEDNLREAQKLRAVGELASGIAHDFNNLLAAILGFGELILYEAPDDEAIRRHVSGISEAGESGAELVRQLLAFGRRQRLKPEELELNAVVSEFADMLRRLLDRSIEVIVQLDPEPCLVRADRGSIERVLMNLVLNARDAMPDGGRLILRTRAGVALTASNVDVVVPDGVLAEDAAGDFASFVVEDTGMGLDDESRSRMFEPFFTTKGLGKGTGLGLSTVHGIVGQSGGRVSVRSSLGAGTSIEVLIPAIRRSPLAGEAREADAPQSGPAGERPRQQLLRVLLVDDEPGVRQSVGALLRSLGHDVHQEQDPVSALELIREGVESFDLLLTDVRMPGLTGPELAERVRGFAPDLPVLYMSGYHEEFEGLVAGQLQKPFGARKLAEAIATTLRGTSTPVVEHEPSAEEAHGGT